MLMVQVSTYFSHHDTACLGAVTLAGIAEGVVEHRQDDAWVGATASGAYAEFSRWVWLWPRGLSATAEA